MLGNYDNVTIASAMKAELSDQHRQPRHEALVGPVCPFPRIKLCRVAIIKM